MSVTLTLSLTTVAFVVYIAGFLFIAGIFISDEMGFKNPEYVKVIIFAALWPLGVLAVVFQQATGIYIGDKWNDLKRWNKQRKCNHNNTEPCGEYTLPSGKEGEKICMDCGKVWWE